MDRSAFLISGCVFAHALFFVPPQLLALEQSLEFIKDDELVEITPQSIRLRKRVLESNKRPKSRDKME